MPNYVSFTTSQKYVLDGFVQSNLHFTFSDIYVCVHAHVHTHILIQACLTLCDPMVCRPPGSSAHGILQAKILESVAIPFSRRSSQPRDRTQVSHITGRLFPSGHQGIPKIYTYTWPIHTHTHIIYIHNTHIIQPCLC